MGEKMKAAGVLGGLALAIAFFALANACCGPFFGVDNLRYPLLAAAVLYGAASWIAGTPWKGELLKQALSHRAFPWILCAAAAFLFFRIKLLQWYAGQISGVDFSHIDYAIWSTAHGRFMEIPIIPPQATFTDFFGNHFSPVLFVFVLARWLVDSPFASLFVHALALAAAIPALHALAAKVVDRVTASLLTLNYVFCGAVASTLQFDIHQECFYPLAIALLFLGVYGSPVLLWIGAALAFSVKEDAGVYLFPAFLFLAWFFPRRRLSCVLLSFISLAYVVVALKVLMPLHQPLNTSAPYYLPMWARYGHSFREVALAMITHPHRVAWDILSNKDLYKNLLPWGFLPVFSPFGVLSLVPLAVASAASGVQRSLGLYYGIVLVPIFFFSTLPVLARSRHRRTIALVLLALGAFVGGSYLRFFSPLPFYPELQNAAEKLAAGNPGETVYVQSGLLPFLTYDTRWRRIDSLDQIPPAGTASVALFDGLSQGSVAVSFGNLGRELESKGYHLKEKAGRLRWYR
jgi:uncharacterized membrane protein